MAVLIFERIYMHDTEIRQAVLRLHNIIDDLPILPQGVIDHYKDRLSDIETELILRLQGHKELCEWYQKERSEYQPVKML